MGVGAGPNDEVVLKLGLGTIINEVDTGINGVLGHSTIVRNVGVPLGRVVADKVVALTRQQVCAHHPSQGVAAYKLHTEHVRWRGLRNFMTRLRKLGGPPRKLGPLGFESEHGRIRRQIEQVAAAAGNESHPAVGLPLIGFKAEGKFAVRCDRARLLGL